MQISRVMLLGATLALPMAAHAQSAPGWQQTLQGLFTGNQSQDDALRQAYQRGYQRGRDDEARAQPNNRRRYGAGPYGNDTGPRYGDQD
jgi:hypothetical protein